MSSSSIIWELRESPNLFSNTWLRPAADNSGAPESPQYSMLNTDTQSYNQYYSQYTFIWNVAHNCHQLNFQVWAPHIQPESDLRFVKLISNDFLHLTFASGLTYITVLVRSNEGQSSWFCYLICLQLLVNWVQFHLHRSDAKLLKVLTVTVFIFLDPLSLLAMTIILDMFICKLNDETWFEEL